MTNEKQRKNLNKLNWPKTNCFLKTGKSWIEYRALDLYQTECDRSSLAFNRYLNQRCTSQMYISGLNIYWKQAYISLSFWRSHNMEGDVHVSICLISSTRICCKSRNSSHTTRNSMTWEKLFVVYVKKIVSTVVEILVDHCIHCLHAPIQRRRIYIITATMTSG